MSLLDAEAIERMGPALDAALSGGPPPEPPPAPSPPSSPQIETATDEATSPAPDVNQSANEEPPAPPADAEVKADAEDEGGHNVPYGRFKKVLEARNGHRDEVAALRSKLSDLEAQQASLLQERLAQRSTQAQVQSNDESSWLDELVGDDGQAQAPQVDPRLQGMAKQIEAQGVQLHRMQLEREVGAAMKKYPGVDRNQILQGVVQNPQASVMDIAEQYSSFVAGVEERAVANYLKQNPQLAEAIKAEAAAEAKAPAPNAPPRPQKVSGGSPPSIWATDERPKTVDEGSALLRDFLTRHNPFA